MPYAVTRTLNFGLLLLQGDPSAVPYAVKNVQEVLGQKPVFGICMGHQILGQAVGGATFKLKFGHHGGNHPIRFNESGAPQWPLCCAAHILKGTCAV